MHGAYLLFERLCTGTVAYSLESYLPCRVDSIPWELEELYSSILLTNLKASAIANRRPVPYGSANAFRNGPDKQAFDLRNEAKESTRLNKYTRLIMAE
jgi:hypothetical protein